jgi:Lon protease-like protein|tara:strand:+ start:196 stop:780 length:585 start_codon:yes stop_codon:yes gene_type:complete
MQISTNNVPIFPLSVALFPEGVLSLRIFETRYLDMVSRCLKQNMPFGVNMIEDGHEVGDAAKCYAIGTLAKIINWDQSADGVLQIEALGCQRFSIVDSQVSDQQLRTASIKILEEPVGATIPAECSELITMLQRILKKHQPNSPLDESRFKDANWVSCRLTEVFPMENIMRQRLLEIDNPTERLEVILGLLSAH